MTDKPHRIQRKRTRGWRMPANTVYVGRPTRWGNPGKTWADYCMYLYLHPGLEAEARAELRGKNLACWCPLVDENGEPVPCHADILLEIANGDSAT
jgi:hypothetical protein